MEQALAVVEQKEVEFYGDTIIAVRAQSGGVYVPVRPICDLLGVDWSAQRQRITRDPVLSAELTACVVVATTQGQPDQRREMLARPPTDDGRRTTADNQRPQNVHYAKTSRSTSRRRRLHLT